MSFLDFLKRLFGRRPTPPQRRQFTFKVKDATNVQGTLRLDARYPDDPQAAPHASTQSGPETYLFDLDPSIPTTYGSTLMVDADWMDTFVARAQTPDNPKGALLIQQPDGSLSTAPIVMTPEDTRLFAAEVGPIRQQDGYFLDHDDMIWDWRGATMFMLFARFWRSEDITPQIDWMQKNGINVARVFVAGHPGLSEFDSFVNAWKDDPNFWTTYQAFLDRMAREGLRVEVSVITDESKDPSTWHEILQKTYDASEGRWNVFIEWCNEPTSRAGRMEALEQVIAMGIDRKGILSAYGIEPEGVSEAEGNFKPCKALDYVTCRSGRDLLHFAQNGKELMERWNVMHLPIVDDEPLGVAETDQPGRRTADEFYVANHFSVARLFSAGATLHTQCGLEGRSPSPDEPVQNAISQAVSLVWLFMPGFLQQGSYMAPHISGWPVEWKGNPGGDSQVNHAYGKRSGNTVFVVNVLSRDGWTVVAKDGWKVVSPGPYPWIGELVQ